MLKSIFNSLLVLFVLFLFSGCAAKTFHDAAKNNDLQAFKQEVANGTDVNKGFGIHSISMLHFASRSSNKIDIVKYLVENGANINAKTYFNQTPLHLAAWNKNAPLCIVKYLVDNGADMEIRDDWGGTPLHNAAGNKNGINIVKYLVEKGANINAKNRWNKTPLNIALKVNNTYIANYLNNEAPYVKEKQEATKLAKLEKEKDEKAVNTYIAKKDLQGLKDYTDKNPNAVYYIEDVKMRLLLTGPKGMKVGDIRKLIKSGEDEVLIISLIKRVKTPYKEYTLNEIKYLKSLGLNSKIISAMIDVTTQLLRDAKLKKEQEFFLAEKNRIAKRSKSKIDANGNPILEKVQDEVIKQGVGMLLDHLF
ncbi:ankyrin repeat domain-containing protein [Sulfurimonas sp.]|uniref:ankyrin repeat domain-containing protein n=1 Tax=Sulfurimonas sp. TaxID=2022749 RepID=UPI003566F8AB